MWGRSEQPLAAIVLSPRPPLRHERILLEQKRASGSDGRVRPPEKAPHGLQGFADGAGVGLGVAAAAAAQPRRCWWSGRHPRPA